VVGPGADGVADGFAVSLLVALAKSCATRQEPGDLTHLFVALGVGETTKQGEESCPGCGRRGKEGGGGSV